MHIHLFLSFAPVFNSHATCMTSLVLVYSCSSGGYIDSTRCIFIVFAPLPLWMPGVLHSVLLCELDLLAFWRNFRGISIFNIQLGCVWVSLMGLLCLSRVNVHIALNLDACLSNSIGLSSNKSHILDCKMDS